MKKIINFCLFCVMSLTIAMERPIKTIQTKKINESWWPSVTYPIEIEYSPRSSDKTCRYIQRLKNTNEALKSFLEENNNCTILLVGPSSLKTIDFSLMDAEQDEPTSCAIL